jgi:CRP/FNR family transcriptional regulator
MNVSEIEEIIAGSDLFSGADTAIVSMVARGGLRRRLHAGESLFLEGDRGDSFFILVHGAIRVFKSTPDGRELTVKMLKPGENFGEVILAGNNAYPASAVAAAPSEILEIRSDLLDRMLDDHDMRLRFVGMLMGKMRYLTERVRYLSSLDVEERFFRFIHEHYGPVTEIPIALSKKEMAAAIGTIPETFSRMLTRLKKRDLLKWDDQGLQLTSDWWQAYSDE